MWEICLVYMVIIPMTMGLFIFQDFHMLKIHLHSPFNKL